MIFLRKLTLKGNKKNYLKRSRNYTKLINYHLTIKKKLLNKIFKMNKPFKILLNRINKANKNVKIYKI